MPNPQHHECHIPVANASGGGPFVVQIVGYKNTGKTTLVCRLTELLKQRNYKVGTVKSDAHDFEMDEPGTDTWRHQQAGADITAISSSRRSAVLSNAPSTLAELLGHMKHVDIVLVEGFKRERYPKLALVRHESDAELLAGLSHIAAAVLWPEAVSIPSFAERKLDFPVYSVNDPEGLAAFLISMAEENNPHA